MNDPRISIVIPCFNAERWVGESIESALRQTYANKEVIVVDDGSTDKSLDVIRSFGSRIRWETRPHQGATVARNRGIAIASGELVQFHDADDILYPQKLARQVPLAVRDDNALVYCDWENLDVDGVVRTQSESCGNEDPVVFMIARSVSGIAPLHWKKWLLAAGGFRADLPCAQEYDLQLRLACMGLRLSHLPEVLFRAQKRKESISADYVRVLDQFEGILGSAYDSLWNAGRLTKARRRALACRLCRSGRQYIQRRYDQRGLRYYQLARKMDRNGALSAYTWPARLAVQMLGPVWLERIRASYGVAMRRKMNVGGDIALA